MKRITGEDFVVQRIDVGEFKNDAKQINTRGGAELRSALGGVGEPGFPFFVMTDEEGNSLRQLLPRWQHIRQRRLSGLTRGDRLVRRNAEARCAVSNGRRTHRNSLMVAETHSALRLDQVKVSAGKMHRYSRALHLHLEAMEKSVTALMDLTAQLGESPCPN